MAALRDFRRGWWRTWPELCGIVALCEIGLLLYLRRWSDEGAAKTFASSDDSRMFMLQYVMVHYRQSEK